MESAKCVRLSPEEITSGVPKIHPNILQTFAQKVMLNGGYSVGNKVVLSLFGQKRCFTVKSVTRSDETMENVDFLIVTPKTQIVLEDAKQKKESKVMQSASIQSDRQNVPTVSFEDIGGLGDAIQSVREIIELPLLKPHLFDGYGITPPKGVLLYGPSGTGKTMIAKAIAAHTNASFFVVNGPEIIGKFYGESESKLRELFQTASRSAPSVIFFDEIDAIAPKREQGVREADSRVVATLLTLLDGIDQNQKVVVIAATNRPEAIDIALRRPGRFDREVEIGIPNEKARLDILSRVFKNMPHTLTEDQVQDIASKTHGYVGADLASLAKEAAFRAIRESDSEVIVPVSYKHLLNCLTSIRPSAMREVAIDIPKVRWDDIGGQADVRQRLKEAVEWPLKYPEAFQRMGIRPPKGVLLYGPPGCSKTMMAKAIATESGLNFIAIKGPELFSKWVGDSEKAVRDVFRKARAASPSIVFFDEIDALTVERGSGAGTVADRVLSQLLNELDGISPLSNVTVIAATNRPDIIDKAIMRPGRIDRILYVAPPSSMARLEILRISLRKTPVCGDVDLDVICSKMHGFSGAEVTSVCREAAMSALEESLDAKEVEMRHFENALSRVRPAIDEGMLRYFEEYQSRTSLQKI
eukprot:TRINITY_DN7375_c0_g1_i7.p1 TRINITY_DN7375_c0_g1~~TRINITY_DN7375_c0_g1_i7.p1  ORF type:complete len:640 (+),score=119.74 TRINITY_DN7375_c0_g1_i7:611-2530(+)